MTVLLTSGDIWTSGWPLEERLGHREFGWPNLVSQHFSFDLVDKSRAGSSNDRIYRKAFDGILSGADIVIVALTSYLRFETGGNYGTKPGRIYQHLIGDLASRAAFDLFFNGYLSYTNMLRQIISLQILAEKHKTACYFLDTFQNNLRFDLKIENFKNILKSNIKVFDEMDDQRIVEKFTVVKNLELDIDQSKFIHEKSYQTLITGCKLEEGHPGEDGHKKISNIIINFLEDKHGKTI